MSEQQVIIYGRDISTNEIITVPVGGIGQNRFIFTSAGIIGPEGPAGPTGQQGIQGE